MVMSKGRKIGLGSGGIMGLIGIGLIIIGIIIPQVIDGKVKEGLQENLELKSGTTSFNVWINNTQKDSQPQFQKFYLFNVTNPLQVISGQQKPFLQQVGPYVYRKWMVRYNVTFSPDQNQVQFKTYTYFTFEPNQTVGNPHQDLITTVNLPFQGVKSKLGSEWWETLIAEAAAGITNSPPFTQKTAHQLIWGYNDTLLEFLANLQPNSSIDPLTLLQQNQTSLDDSNRKVKYDTIKTGKTDLNNVLQYVKFQDLETVPFWGSEAANKVEGSDGSMSPPGLKVGDKISPWIDVAWRTLLLKGSENINVQGLDLIRFKIDPTVFDNSTTFPSNGAYWQFGPSGVGNLTNVFQGTPIFLSSPHFLDADPFYLSQVDGLQPNRSLHETSLDIDPITGITLSVRKRLQIVCQMGSSFVSNPDFKPAYIPVMWADLSSELTKDVADQISESNSQIRSAQTAKNAAKFGGLITGSILVVVSLAVLAIIGRKIIQEKNAGYSTIQ
eukprot:TRINITY_DN459_c1_g1_i1.p1 TRINITY_DN459_c1_g1~~TRINITY_DN459_c1_g1_i1.p1  ORF type:complete len:497 (+),score=126.34 TRINITY_DN459_c1_g1_i1:1875-3365(+)